MSGDSIFIALSPNVEKDDLFLALKLFFQPWRWKKGKGVEKLEEKFREFLGVEYAFAFESGRSALLALLDGLGLKEGSEVLVPALTCNALVNPLIWSGLSPRYVDIREETLNMDPRDLEKKINEKSRAVIAQHTFGLPAEMEDIQRICAENNLILIEDCAHCLGADYKKRKAGTLGRAAFFSLGRSKVISSVYGGMAVTNHKHLAEKLEAFRKGLDWPSLFWVGQQILHPVLNEVLVKPLYPVSGLGRLMLVGFQKTGFLSKAVHKKEKKGKQPSRLLKKMANGLALLGLNQMEKIDRILYHQKKRAAYYREALSGPEFGLPAEREGRVYMRFPILLNQGLADKIRKEARKENMFLDDGWHTTPVVPPDTNQEKMGYFWGQCPVAEKAARKILNLPTNINVSQKDAKGIIKFLKQRICRSKK